MFPVKYMEYDVTMRACGSEKTGFSPYSANVSVIHLHVCPTTRRWRLGFYISTSIDFDNQRVLTFTN
jgi:hypothetical protein